MWEFQGIIPAEISSWFLCGNEGEMKGNFLCGYFRFLSLWNPWGYFRVEISLVLPSKISKCNLMTQEGSQLCENIPVMIWCHSLENQIVYRFGETSLSFQPDLKISPEFPREISFHLQPKFPRWFPPPTTTILGDSSQNPRDFARWVMSLHCCEKLLITNRNKRNFVLSTPFAGLLAW